MLHESTARTRLEAVGNTGLTPTIGVSYGNGQAYVLAATDGASTLTSANSVQWTLAPGFTDIGAYEFRGSGADVTPPVTTGIPPAAASFGPTTDRVTVAFSEPLNAVDAASPANYELRSAGPDGVFGTAWTLMGEEFHKGISYTGVMTWSVTAGYVLSTQLAPVLARRARRSDLA